MPIAGNQGYVKVGSQIVADIKTWSLDISAEQLDTSAFGSEWRSAITGLKSWNGSLGGNFSIDSDNNGQGALETAFLSQNPIQLVLGLKNGTSYNGEAVITDMNIEDDVEGQATIAFDFQGKGAIARTSTP